MKLIMIYRFTAQLYEFNLFIFLTGTVTGKDMENWKERTWRTEGTVLGK